MFLQLGLKAPDSVVHHVHFHQAQNLEDSSDTGGNRYLYYERKSSEGEPTQDIIKSPCSRGRRGFKTNLVLPPKFTKDGTEA